MTPLAGQPILTAAEMRAAEMACGVPLSELMERAGRAVADAVLRLGNRAPVLVLCGPGNNGGDGYVAARVLADAGATVRVAVAEAPKTDLARDAAARWLGEAVSLDQVEAAPIVVDALFGTGLSRALPTGWSDALIRLVRQARFSIAVDLPSGVSTDDGAVLSPVPKFDLTLALGATKPAHLLQPAARWMGAVRVADIGIEARSSATVLGRPDLPQPGPDSHKYSRGYVAVVSGEMPGASLLAATAAMHAGAGYVALLEGEGGPAALVHKPLQALSDERIGAVVVGPGLGKDNRERLERVLDSGRPMVIDGDALRMIDPDAERSEGAILTPHAGEFDALFGKSDASKIERAREAAARTGAIVVFKGPDTVIAAPDGRVAVSTGASPWLSAAGTGDVLAGAIAAMRAAGLEAFEAAKAGVWLHGRAAELLGPAFIADELASALAEARR